LLTDIAADTLSLTDVTTGKEVRRFQMPEDKEYYAVVAMTRVSADGKTVLALGQSHPRQISGSIDINPPQPLCAWDAATGKLVLTQTVSGWIVGGAAFSPDGRLLLLE